MVVSNHWPILPFGSRLCGSVAAPFAIDLVKKLLFAQALTTLVALPISWAAVTEPLYTLLKAHVWIAVRRRHKDRVLHERTRTGLVRANVDEVQVYQQLRHERDRGE